MIIKLKFIYCQLNTGIDGIMPYDISMRSIMRLLLSQSKVKRYFEFPLEVETHDGNEWSITNYALSIARAYCRIGHVTDKTTQVRTHKKVMENFRKTYIRDTLIGNGGNIAKTADELQVNRKTIYYALGDLNEFRKIYPSKKAKKCK